MNRCGRMSTVSLRKFYKEWGRGISEGYHLSDSRCNSVEEKLFLEVYLATWFAFRGIHGSILDTFNSR